jgi:putative sigma-54 modulation protein
MQTRNVNLPITVTGRHVSITEAIRDHANSKLENIHLDYPKIIEAKVILDVQNYRHIAEVILYCANHITIEATTETDDMYASIDGTVSKIARQMRKFKTRMLQNHRPRKGKMRHLDEAVFASRIAHDDHADEEAPEEPDAHEPVIVHQENIRIRPLFKDEAIMDLELSDRPFLIYHNADTDKLTVLYRRKDGDYGAIEPVDEN